MELMVDKNLLYPLLVQICLSYWSTICENEEPNTEAYIDRVIIFDWFIDVRKAHTEQAPEWNAMTKAERSLWFALTRCNQTDLLFIIRKKKQSE